MTDIISTVKDDTGYCLFCNELIYLTSGRGLITEDHPDGSPGKFIQSWVTKIELIDFSGLKTVHEADRGSMFLCQKCLANLHRSIENNLRLASQ